MEIQHHVPAPCSSSTKVDLAQVGFLGVLDLAEA